MKKTAILLLLALVIITALAGCARPPETVQPAPVAPAPVAPAPVAPAPVAPEEIFVIKMGYGTAPGHPIDLASVKFKEEVERKSNGRIEVRLFPSAQLGGERQLIEGLQAGTIQMTPTTTGPMGLFDPSFFVFDLPYIFENEEAADRVLDGPIGQELLEGLEEIGIIGLAWWENGFRQITNNTRPITYPQDMQGIKLRTMENEVHMRFFGNIGATPTPMGFGEIYMALRSGTVDGQENPVSIIAANKFYEVQEYLTLTDHVYSPVVVLVSKIFWDELPEDLRVIVRDSAVNLREFQRRAGRDQKEEFIETIRNAGTEITVLTEEQKQAWRVEAEKIYPEFEEKIGKELLEKVRAAGWGN